MIKCQKILLRGKNKGKKCCDVSSRCRHSKSELKCKCGKVFELQYSYSRHVKTCMKSKKQVKVTAMGMMKEELRKVTDTNEEILKEIKKRPPVLNFYIGDNVYDDLVEKMGKEDAVDFLIRAASDNNPLSVIDKLYLDDRNKEDWPLAYNKEGEFKYLNKNKQMIVDKTGTEIVKLFGKVHNAMIQAVSEMINKNLTGQSVDGMYDTYNLQKIQGNLYKMCGRTELLCGKFKKKIINQVHPFFNVYFMELFFDDMRIKNIDRLDGE